MARFDNLSYDYSRVLEPLDSIYGFLEELYDIETKFGADEKREDSLRRPTCYLDYMFVWLVEGRGAIQFPTFEDWLLAIIRYADDLYSPRNQYATGTMAGEPLGTQDWLPARRSTSMGLLDWGATSRDEKLNEEYVNDAHHRLREISAVIRPADEEGMRHPALDRNVYVRCREHALAREQEWLLERKLAEALPHAAKQ